MESPQNTANFQKRKSSLCRKLQTYLFTMYPIQSTRKVIYVKIIPFIRPRLSKNQFYFLRNRSCLTQLLVSFNKIFTSIEEGQAVDAIYFDFKKAFDSIPHAELLYKLWTIGITGPL